MCMNLKDTMLSKVGQIQKDKNCYESTYWRYVESSNS